MMATPRRRSSRLRTPAKTTAPTPARPLSSLAERDESPTEGVQSILDAILSSPAAPRTPATVQRIQPAEQEMHPSKAHQSTTQEPDSGLRLGFVDINAKGSNNPSGANQSTPSKTSSFDFRFARPGPELGPEAQRLMDDLREEAMRIKANLAAKREEEKRNEAEDAANIGGRKIAQPKGKMGRFSDVHMAQFKKMDSIAGHPSSFRAQQGRFPPSTNNLKRTQSKAKLDDREELVNESPMVDQAGRLQNTSPAKRARQATVDDNSLGRLTTVTVTPKTTAPTTQRLQSNFLDSITTPTKASLARAASAKQTGKQIPQLARTPSRPNLAAATTQRLTKSVTTNSISSPFPKQILSTPLRGAGRFERVKAMLRHPSASLRKPTSIPTLAKSPSRPNLNKVLPTVPRGLDDSKEIKAVSFSPSPTKSGIPRSTSKINVGRKIAQPRLSKIQYPSISDHPSLSKQPQEIHYPSLGNLSPLPHAPQAKTIEHPPASVPGNFTFRSDHTINFGTSPKGFGSSPGQSSVRQVRPSITPQTMPGTFPSGSNKENVKALPSFPHGLSNKKRRRVNSDHEEEDSEAERSPKKRKAVAEGENLMAPKLLAKEALLPKQPSPPKKKVLSISRLNMLSRPKHRQ